MRAFSAPRLIVALVTATTAATTAGAAASPEDLVARPIVLEDGQLAAQVAIESSFASKQFARPLSIAPDAWYGLTARWTLGVVHSDAALDLVDFGASLCVRTSDVEPGECPRVYHGGGLDARYLAWSGTSHGRWSIAPRARLLVRDLSPWKPAATIGALAQWQRGRWSITTDPYLRIALANSDLGNDSALVVPIYVAIQPTCRWKLDLETGYVTDLAVWQDGFHIPVAFDVTARATTHLDVGAQVGLTSALGPQNNVKQREVWLLFAWRS